VVNALATKPGINGANTLSIPKEWDSVWFRKFIANSLKGADVRNAVGANGISVTGTIASPYATIGFGAPVTLPAPVTISSSPGQISLTVNGASGLTAIVINATGTSNPVQGLLISNDGVHDVDMAISTSSAGDSYYRAVNLGGVNWSFGNRRSDNAFVISAAVGLTNPKFTIATTGAITIPVPSAGTSLTVNAIAGQNSIIATDGTVICAFGTVAGTEFYNAVTSNHAQTFYTNNVKRLTIAAAGGATFTGTLAYAATTSTGANTATLGANKPGSAVALTPNTWETVVIGGTTFFRPLWI
jgi:hypothetical protein